MIRVLIVDDSPTARSLLTAILSSDPGIQVVGEAADGFQGVELARKLRPDLITMDIRMPGMDGLVATKEIMIENPTPILIVTASRAIHDVELSMQMLRQGALALLEKPAGPGSPTFDETSRQLLEHVKTMAHVKVVRHWRSMMPGARPAPKSVPKTGQINLLAVAASTGGPAALAGLLAALPAGFRVPILVVQHISHGFVGGLAEWLAKVGPLHVKLAEADESLKPATVYIAPDDHHLGVSSRGRVVLTATPPIGGFRPSASYLFESVAHAYGAKAGAAILTGMGDDGVAGLRFLHKAGGLIIAQDENTSVVFGMPAAAIAAGVAHEVLPLEDIAARLVALIE